MLASSRPLNDIWSTYDSQDLISKRLKRLCSPNVESAEIESIIDDLKNFTMFGLNEDQVVDLIASTLPDTTKDLAFHVLSQCSVFLSSSKNELVLQKCKSLLQTYPGRFQLFNDNTEGAAEFSQLVWLLKGAIYRGDENNLKKIIKLCSEKFEESTPSELLEEFVLLLRTNENLKSKFVEILPEIHGLFPMTILSLLFVEAKDKDYSLWKNRMDLNDDSGHGIQVGKILVKLGSYYIDRFVFFLLSYIQNSEHQESMAVFFALAFSSFPMFTRSEIINELLVLTSDLEDQKYIKYLNSILDGVHSGFSLNMGDFKAALDSIDMIPLSMVLEYYIIIVKIALKMNMQSNSQAINELCLIIRKQLASPFESICIVGIAGSLALLSAKIDSIDADTFDFNFASCSQPNRKKEASGVSLALQSEFLFLSLAAAPKFSSSCKFLYQQLSVLVEKDQLASELTEKLSDSLAEDFQKSFITEVEEDIPPEASIKFNLMSDEELIVVRVYPLICRNDVANRIAHLNLFIRLLSQLEKKLNAGTLENIDAILKFPLALPGNTSNPKLLFASNLVSLNYLREILGCFSDQSDPAIQENCLKRIDHINALQSEIVNHMKKFPTFSSVITSFMGPLIDPSLTESSNRESDVSSADGIQLLEKISSYSQDRKFAPSSGKNQIKMKAEEDLWKALEPLPLHVFQLLELGIGQSDKKLMLSQDDFLFILNELKLQLRFNEKIEEELLHCFDKAVQLCVQFKECLESDSNLLTAFPKIILELVPILRSRNVLKPQRITAIRSAFESCESFEANSDHLRLEILLCRNESEEIKIIQNLVRFLETEDSDLQELAWITPEIKCFRESFRPILDFLSKIQAKSFSKTVHKAQMDLLVGEVSKSNCLESDLWLMEHLEQCSQSSKSSYNSDCVNLLLKVSREAIDLIVRDVMPRLEHFLLERKDEVIAILKRFQQFTRTIQTICNHVKSTKDKALLNRVPPLKKSLESALMRVKQVLETNQCHSAFWVGNLKHKGLDGKEVPSQIPLKRDPNEAIGEEEEDGSAEAVEDDNDEIMDDNSEGAIDPTLGLSL